MIELVKANRLYRHYKGGLYLVITESVHTETHDVFVTYKSKLDTWSTPRSRFFETVEYEGKQVPRFTLIEKNEDLLKEFKLI